MSTIALDYPSGNQVRLSASIRWLIFLIASLVLAVSVILVAASSVKADASSGALLQV